MTIFVQQLLGTIPGNFAALAALALFCALIGDAALGLLLPGFRRKRLCVALILGGDLMALAALFLNRWLPGASPVEAFAAAAVPAVAAGFWLWRAGRLPSLFSIALHWRRDWLFWLPVTGCIVWYLGSALIPPFSWDEQTYQLAVPAAWLLRGNCAPTADLPYSAFPLMPQFLLLWGMKWSGIGVAKLLVLGVFWILFRMTYDELCHLVPRLAAGILLLVFVVSPVNLFMIREFYAEGFLAVQLLAAVRLRRALAPVFSCRRLAVFGIFAGFAASVKLTGAGTAAAILLAALPGDGFTRPLTFWRNPAHLRALAAFAGAAMLAAMGFYLRPWLALGNPCYPFLAEIFGAPGDTVARYHFLMGDQYYGIGKLPALGLGWIFCAFYDDIYDGILTGFGFTVLFGSGYLLWAYFRRNGVKSGAAMNFYGCALTLMYCFWCFSAQQTRFLLPLFPLVLFFAAAALRHCSRKWFWIAVSGALLAQPLHYDWMAWTHGRNCWKAYFASPDRQDAPRMVSFGMQDEGMMIAYHYLWKETPPDTRVLLAFERRSLYCPRISYNGTPGFQDWLDYEQITDLAGELRRRGIGYVILNETERNPDRLEAFSDLELAVGNQFAALLRDGEISVVRVPYLSGRLLLKVENPSPAR